MFGKPAVVVGILASLSRVAPADVIVNYTSPADLDPATPQTELMPSSSATIEISLSSKSLPVPFFCGGSFEFNSPTGLMVNTFAWNRMFSNPNLWFADPTLPTPSLFCGSASIRIPVAPSHFDLAAFHVTIGASSIGTMLDLITNAQLHHPSGGLLQLTPSSGFIRFVVVPEPSTGLLLIGGLVVSRRHRASSRWARVTSGGGLSEPGASATGQQRCMGK